MANDLRVKSVRMPVIPDSRIVRVKLQEVLEQANRLRILLRLATELEEGSKANREGTRNE